MLLPMSDLQEMARQITAIISEFESASARQGDVQDAVGRPAGDSRLRDRCHDFEGSWNDSRDKLLSKLQKVSERVQGTIDETNTADLDLASQMEQASTPAPTGPGAGPGRPTVN
jgi:hypothetical protein